MQEKNATPEQNWDEQFVDAGWEQMRALLDEELPVEEERQRRFAFWWWLGALLLLGGLVAWLLWGDTPTPASLSDEPIAKEERRKTKDEGRNTKYEIPSTKDEIRKTKEQGGKKQEARGKSSETRSKRQEIAITDNQQPVINQQATINNQKLPTSNQSASSNQPATNNQQLKTNNNTFDDHQQSRAATPTEAVERAVFAELPLLLASDVALLTTKDQKPIFETDQPQTWHLGMTALAAVQTGQFPQPDGQSVGVLLQLQRKTSRWALETGLLYQHFAKNQSSNDEAFVSIEMDEPETTGGTIGTETINVADYTNVNPEFLRNSITDLSYLTLPVSARWQAARRFYLHGGLAFSYLLNGRTYKVENLQDSQFGLTGGELRQASINSLSGASNIPLRRFDWSGQLGVSYYPMYQLGLHLSYNLGFNSYIQTDTEDLESYNRYLQLGVVYRLR